MGIVYTELRYVVCSGNTELVWIKSLGDPESYCGLKFNV